MKNEANKFIENYYLTEGALSKLEQNIGDYQSVMDTFKGKDVDGLDAVKEYMDYVQQIDDLSHQLAMNGASPEVKRTLMKMQSRYNAVFDPIKEAEAANKKWRDIAQSLGPDELYDPRQLTYEYLLGKNTDTGEYNYNGIFQHIDAGTARKEVENVAKELADQIFTNGNSLPLQRLNNAGVQSLLRYGVDINDYNAVLNAISQGEGKRTPENLTDKQKLLYGIVEDIVNQKDLDSYGLSDEQKNRYWNIAAEGLASAIGTPKFYAPPEPKVTGNGGGNRSGNGSNQQRAEESDFSPYRENPITFVNRTTEKERWNMMEKYAHRVKDKPALSNDQEIRKVQDLLRSNNLIIMKKGQNSFTQFVDRNAPALGIEDDLTGVRFYEKEEDIPNYKNKRVEYVDELGKYKVTIWGESLQEVFEDITKMGSNQRSMMNYGKVVADSTEKDGIFSTLKRQNDAHIVKMNESTGQWEPTKYHGDDLFCNVPTDDKKDHALTSKMIDGYDTTPQGVVVHFTDGKGEKVHVLYDDKNNSHVGQTAYRVNYANAVGLAQQQMEYYLSHNHLDNFEFDKINDLISTYKNGTKPIGYKNGDKPLTYEGNYIVDANRNPVFNMIEWTNGNYIFNITFQKLPMLLKKLKEESDTEKVEKVKLQLVNLIQKELDNNKQLHDDEAYDIFRIGKPQVEIDKP